MRHIHNITNQNSNVMLMFTKKTVPHNNDYNFFLYKTPHKFSNSDLVKNLLRDKHGLVMDQYFKFNKV